MCYTVEDNNDIIKKFKRLCDNKGKVCFYTTRIPARKEKPLYSLIFTNKYLILKLKFKGKGKTLKLKYNSKVLNGETIMLGNSNYRLYLNDPNLMATGLIKRGIKGTGLLEYRKKKYGKFKHSVHLYTFKNITNSLSEYSSSS